MLGWIGWFDVGCEKGPQGVGNAGTAMDICPLDCNGDWGCFVCWKRPFVLAGSFGGGG